MGKFLALFIILIIYSSQTLACNAKRCSQLFNDSDITQGFYFQKSGISHSKKYGMQIVNSSDGHPVRKGKKSIRFEVGMDDCNGVDCKTDRARWEFTGKDENKSYFSGTWWYAWSIFYPKDVETPTGSKIALGQFKAGENPPFMFQAQRNGAKGKGITPVSGGYWIDNQVPLGGKVITTRSGTYLASGVTNEIIEGIKPSEFKGKWIDVLINAKWTSDNDGFFKVWLNKDLKYDWKGPTKARNEGVFFKFGVYRSFLVRDLIVENIKTNKKFESCFKNDIKTPGKPDGLKQKHIDKIKEWWAFNNKMKGHLVDWYSQCKKFATIKKSPKIVVYFDEIRAGRSRKSVEIN